MPDLHDLINHAAPRPSAPVDVDALWRAGRWRRSARRSVGALSAIVLLAAGTAAVAALSGPTVRFADSGADDAAAAGSRDGDATAGDEADDVTSVASSGEPAAVRIGALLPLSGDLAFFGPALQAAVELAVDDLNAAGGVLGQPVELVTADSADGVDNGEALSRAVDDLLAQDLAAVVGPVSSGQRLEDQVQRLAQAGVLVVSPSASAPEFGQGSDGLIGRLSPSAALQGLALADAIAEDGATRVAVLARADDYWQETAAQLRDGLDTAGIQVVDQVDYDQTTQSFAGTVRQVTEAAPDAVVLLGFDESIALLTELAAQGFGPADLPVWSGDGILADTLPPPAIGVRGVRWAAPDDSAFVARLTAAHADLVETGYAAAAYDAVMTIALGSATAGSAEGGQIAARLASVTQPGGEPCSSAAGCLAHVEEGVAVTYEGALGVSALGADNQPTGATYEVFDIEEDGSQRTIDTIEISSG